MKKIFGVPKVNPLQEMLRRLSTFWDCDKNMQRSLTIKKLAKRNFGPKWPPKWKQVGTRWDPAEAKNAGKSSRIYFDCISNIGNM
jgi:hypothetical protein